MSDIPATSTFTDEELMIIRFTVMDWAINNAANLAVICGKGPDTPLAGHAFVEEARRLEEAKSNAVGAVKSLNGLFHFGMRSLYGVPREEDFLQTAARHLDPAAQHTRVALDGSYPLFLGDSDTRPMTGADVIQRALKYVDDFRAGRGLP